MIVLRICTDCNVITVCSSEEILNPMNFVNQNTGFGEVYVRVTNLNNCYNIVNLDLIVATTLIPAGYLETFTECDDTASGSNTDGISTFNLTQKNNDISVKLALITPILESERKVTLLLSSVTLSA